MVAAAMHLLLAGLALLLAPLDAIAIVHTPHATNLAARAKFAVAPRHAAAAAPRHAAVVLDEANTPAAITNATLQERVRLFWRLAVPYFEQADGAKLNFGLMLLLVLVNSGISVIFSFVGRDFYSALSAKDQALFLEKTANFAVGLAVATPLTVLYKFQRQRLALNWREWMTTELARQYYSDQAYYKIEVDRDLDNPDQRICEDVTAFTRVSLDFFITLMTSAIDLVSFSGILYSIYPQARRRAVATRTPLATRTTHTSLTRHPPPTTHHPHPQLFYAIFAYAGFGSLTTVYLGRALVGQNAEQLLREADLRYSLVRLRENAESIAFYQGEAQEAAEVQSRLGGAITNRRAILGTQRNLEFFTTAYSYLVQILPVLVVSPLYFAGSVELGVITQSTGAFNHVLNDLSIIVNQFEGISSFSAGLNRLAAFVERMEGYHRDASRTRQPSHASFPPRSSLYRYQRGGGENATFVLSEEHLARLMADGRRPKPRSLWEWVRYGREGPPKHEARQSADADADADADGDTSLWEAVRYGRAGRPPPPPPPYAYPSSSSSSSMVGVVAPTGRIRNVELDEIPGGGALAVRDLSLLTPDGSRQLFANVSVDVRPGAHLLIMGNSGTGKSSMLRAVAGLWDRGSGEVARPPTASTMFLPQRPYCTLGSLRQQLVYPQTVDAWKRTSTDYTLLSALETVQLGRLAAGGLDAVRDWGDELSLGEQQRLGFARVLVNRPKLAILDEATSALDLANEAAMYTALAQVPGLTYLSVGHRPSLLRFHAQRLRLFGMEQTPSFEVVAVDEAAVAAQLEASIAAGE